MMSGEQDLRRFARQQSQRRDVADSIAGQERCERARQRECDRRRQAEAPAFRTDEKSETGEREDQNKTPPDAPDAVDDLRDARTADGIREERRSCERGCEGEEMLAPHVKSQNPNPKTQIPRN